MDGILVVDKPKGLTSHDVVDFVRKRFGLKKVGHAGTLDPMATGVLVLLIGSCTRSSSRFSNDDKEYRAEMTLGGTSDTGDAWGKIAYSKGPIDFERDKIEDAFRRFTGRIGQIPPMYSAIKHKGRKLYDLARRGVKVELEPRTVFIKNIDILAIELPRIAFRVSCSKGTYVRQLCADIGSVLGCGAYLSGLKRTRSGAFHIDEAQALDELNNIDTAELEKRLHRV